MNRPETYRHTQRAPLCLFVYATAVVMFVIAFRLAADPTGGLIMGAVGVVMLVFAASFHHLHVEDEGDWLGIRFGPLPLFSKTIRYEDITKAELGRTTFMDGCGIHKSLRGGWVWNLWGYDCVTIRHRGITHVGSDDAEKLAAFLNTKIGNPS